MVELKNFNVYVLSFKELYSFGNIFLLSQSLTSNHFHGPTSIKILTFLAPTIGKKT